MASALHRAHLARAAAALNASRGATHLPALILMTDEARLADPLAAARGLPQGSAVIVRHRSAAARETLARALKPFARARKLVLLIAGDAAMAARVDAGGVHLPEAHAREAAELRALRPHWLITAAAHSLGAIGIASRAGADAVLLAPVLTTQSHRGRAAIGAARARAIAALSPIPVYALGGIDAQTAALLRDSRFAGIAAIGGLDPAQSA